MDEMWAKTQPYKTLLHHMIDTGFMAEAILKESSLQPLLKRLKELLPGEKVLNTASCLIALHDIGKCHPFFQAKEPSIEYVKKLSAEGKLSINQKNEYRHEIGGKYIIERVLKRLSLPPKQLRMLGSVLRLHHQKGAQESRACRVPENMDRPFWEKEQNMLFEKVCSVFQPNFHLFANCKNTDGVAVVLWGCTILADWLSSGQNEFFAIAESLPFEEYIKESRKAAQTAIVSAGLQLQKYLPAQGFCDVWQGLETESLRPLQNVCAELTASWQEKSGVPGFVLLEAPMGEGKTEAALFLTAHLMERLGKTGFYVALPTAATSNSMHSRMKSLLADHGIAAAKLMHAQAWLLEQTSYKGETDDAQEAEAWLSPLRRGMLAQYAVGTVDQVMMAVMRIKYGVLRLTGAASKVIVIDEVHAYDSYMLAIIERLLEWCAVLAVPVVMLSATLPQERRNRLLSAYVGREVISVSQAYPLITMAGPENSVQEIAVAGTYMHQHVRLEIRPLLEKWEQVAQLALDKVSNGGCMCVLVNTVHEAQKLFQILRAIATEDISLLLFHARFPAIRRQEIEEKCLSAFGKSGVRPKKAILVATQVVEQSLDLDFDTMITALAPIDLLLQRIGRVHRHEGRIRNKGMETPHVTILVPEGDIGKTATSHVYKTWILKKTWEILNGLNCLRLPDDIRSLVEKVYSSLPVVQDNDYEDWARFIFEANILHERAQPVIYPTPSFKYFFAAEYEGDFFEEESEDLTYIGARTRIGEDSLRIAIVPEALALKAGHAYKAVAESILSQTVSISAGRLKGSRPHPEYKAGIVGEGLLRGVLLLPSDNRRYVFINNKKTYELVIDDEMGLMVKEK